MGLARGKAVHRDLAFFQLATIARVPCTSPLRPFRESLASRVGRRTTPVPPRQTLTHLESLLLISSILCLSRLSLHFHHGRIPYRSFARAWNLLRLSRTDPPLPLKRFVRHSPKLLRLLVPCFPLTSVHRGSRLCLRLWAPREHRQVPPTPKGSSGGVSLIPRSNVLRVCTLERHHPAQTGPA